MTTVTLPNATFPAGALAPVAGLTPWSSESVTIPLSDGGTLSVRLESDNRATWEEYGDCCGKVAEPARHSITGRGCRPEGFDGAAVKIDSRDGPLWFQPPSDIPPEYRANAIARARAYFREEWSFVGVVVTRTSAPVVGPFGGTVAEKETASLWRIESDAGDYFAEVAADLAHELGVECAA